MARKKKLPGRNRLGRFQKKGAKKRRSQSRALVVHRKTRRARKAPARRARIVRKHTRKVPGRARKITVRRHLSREETPMKRRRRARRSRARETVAAERPRRRRRRARARESTALARYTGSVRHVGGTKPRKRRRARKSTALVKRARARRSPRRYGRRVTVSRKVGPRGRRRAVTVRVAGRKKGRYGQKVRVKRRYKGRTRTRTVYVSERKRSRKAPKRRRSSRRYAMAMYENPVGFGGYAMENPLSGKEMVLALATGVMGYTAAEVVDRLLATTAVGQDAPSQAQEALANAGLVQGAPNLMRGAAQAAVAGVPFLAAYWVKNPMGRAALQGFGLGAAVRLLGQLVRTMLIGRVLKDNTTAQRLYGDTIAADASQTTFQDIQDNMVPAPAGVAGPPRLGVGAVHPLLTQYTQGVRFNNDRSGYGSQGAPVAVQTPNGGITSLTMPGNPGAGSGSGGSSGGPGGSGVNSGSGGAAGGPGSAGSGSGSAAGGNGGNVPVYAPLPGSVPYATPYGTVTGPAAIAQANGNCLPCGSQSMSDARQNAANAAQAGLGGVPYNPYNLMSED